MLNSDNLNFRGKYKQYDVNGNPYLYRIGDVVDHKGTQYVAVKNTTSTVVPGGALSETTWQKLGVAGGGFYIQDTPPTSPIAGDRWYRGDVSVLYTCIDQENNLIWVEL